MVFTHFENVGRVPDATLNTLSRLRGFPPALIEWWSTHGTGFIGRDGYVRLIDPAHYLKFLPDWFSDTDGAIPFAATGMGDLFIWQAGVIRWVQYRFADIRDLPGAYNLLATYFESDVDLDGWLERGPYPEAVALHGRPDLYEAFFFAPPLAMGGAPRLENLHRGDLAVSIEIFTQFMGRASLVPGQAPPQDPPANPAGG